MTKQTHALFVAQQAAYRSGRPFSKWPRDVQIGSLRSALQYTLNLPLSSAGKKAVVGRLQDQINGMTTTMATLA